MKGDATGFIHRYFPPVPPDGPAAGTTLLLLHGTGGDENDLRPLGQVLLPEAAMLSPRGKVLEMGMPRFFRRLAEGVFDQEDLARRTDELAEFIEQAAMMYGINVEGVVAVGFSNGANIAASLLLRRPGLICRAVLFSPMVPFEPANRPVLSGTQVFMSGGQADPIVPMLETERLASILRASGAMVTLHWAPGGHQLGADAVKAARAWLATSSAGRSTTP